VPEPKVRNIAWKAQARLCARYRRLIAKGKRATIAVTRELAAFVWDIAQYVEPIPMETRHHLKVTTELA
jgi:transposase